MSAGRRRLTARSDRIRGARSETTFAAACTPASVRPATVSVLGSTASAAATSATTVRRPGCIAQPRKSVPS